jgi:hypothetical protein
LAYLGAGYSHQTGEYHQTVGSGLDYLIRCQLENGDLAGEASLYARMYCHAMATFALAEAWATTGDKKLDSAVRRGVGYSLRAQHPTAGGWRYRPGDTGDTSQLGWQLMALHSAELAGLEIPAPTWSGIERFLRSVARGRYGGLASYRPDGPASRSMTAEALYCRQLMSMIRNGGHPSVEWMDPAAIDEATGCVLSELPGIGQPNLYYWYYASLSLHHQKKTSPTARHAWETWNSALQAALLPTQVAVGADSGSWPPNCIWAGYGGRVYSTALAAMCLEVYYRYRPEQPLTREWVAGDPTNPL